MSTMMMGGGGTSVANVEDERRGDVLKLILYDLNSAIAPREHRLMALRTAVAEFDHDDEYKHDEELDLHADKILFQKLAFAFQVSRSSDEVALICTALEMVYRASRSRIALSFSELRESILPLFVEMLGKPLHVRRQEELEEALKELAVAKMRAEQQLQHLHHDHHPQQNGSGGDDDEYYNHEDETEYGGGEESTMGNSSYGHTTNAASSLTKTLAAKSGQSTAATLKDDDTFGISTKAGDTYLAPSGSVTETTSKQSQSTRNTSNNNRHQYEVETVLSDVDEESTSYETYDDYNNNTHGIPGNDHELETVMEGDEDAASSVAASRVSGTIVGARSTITAHTSVSSGSAGTTAKSLRAALEQRELRGQQEADQMRNELDMIRVEEPTNPIAVAQLLQVLRYFSRVLSAMVPMAHHPALLDALVYQLDRQRSVDHASRHGGGMGEEQDEYGQRQEEAELAASRVDAIATIVNLACAEENKVKMVHHKGLLDALVRLALNDPSEEAREHAAIVIMNLAYADENKVTMVEHDGLLDVLVHLIGDKSPFTRRYASAAMFTLACVVANTERMARHCDGEILEALRRVLSEDPVDEARINASEALFNMARNNTEETVETMGNHPRLLESIARAVLTDYSADVRVYCARALEWMAADVHYPMPCHRTLLSALTVSSQWTKTSCIAEAFKSQATLAENRRPIAMHDGLLKALANLALLEGMNDTDTRASAIAALEMISREPNARKFMVQNELVMTALTHASFKKDPVGQNNEGSPSFLVKEALKNLANDM